METPKRPAYPIYSLGVLILSVMLFSCAEKQELPGWLEGKWKAEFEDYSVTESWKSSGGRMNGKTLWSSTTKNWSEMLTLFRNDKGQLVYRATIDGHSTDFVCSDSNADTLVFINQENDFPKRLNYVKPTNNKLEVWIDNSANDPNRIYFHFIKEK
jgi:hypothetical protein